jgi:lysozyme family protein
MTTEQILDDIIRREGRVYTNHPADRGGPTKFGITQATLAGWRGRPVSANEVAALDEEEARQIYRRRYVADPGFETIADDRLRALLVDTAVLHGPGRSVRWLQTVLGVTADGAIGPQTRAALAHAGANAVYYALVAERGRALVALALSDLETKQFLAKHPKVQLRFLRGWTNRVWEFLE